MLEIIRCPACQRQLCLPEELAGRTVQCPACRQTFQTSAPDEAAPRRQPEPAGEGPLPAAGEVPLQLSLDDDGPRQRLQDLPPPPPLRPVPLATPPEGRHARLHDHLVPCPHCAEMIRPDADRCRFCGQLLDEDEDDSLESLGARRDLEPHRATLILTLGVISVAGLGLGGLPGLPFGLAAWIMGRADLQRMATYQMDPAGRGSTNTGRILGIVGTIADTLYSFCLGYALLVG